MIPNNNSIFQAMRQMGYLPPQCTHIVVEVKPDHIPTISTTAMASPDLAEWIRTLKQIAVEVRIIEPEGQRPLDYLACPYSHPDPKVMEERFHAANRAAARLMEAGALVFSPISHTHPIAVDGELPRGWEFWDRYDRAVLSCCHKVEVLPLVGWRESTGVQAEIAIAKEMGIPVEFLPEDFCTGSSYG